MSNIDIIIRTHFARNRDEGKVRYCGANKAEVTRRCLISLVKSVNQLEPKYPTQVVLYDDHSGAESLVIAQEILDYLQPPHHAKIINATVSGATATMVPAFTWGLEQSHKDLLYFLEDDYLHQPSALSELIGAHQYFTYMLGGRPAALYPFDDPYRYYKPENIQPTRIVLGPRRHWRVNFFTSGTFFTTHAVLARHFTDISALGRVPVSSTMEDDTINKVWKEGGVTLFSPIPSLALHLQFDTEKDPYIKWPDWWDAAKQF